MAVFGTPETWNMKVGDFLEQKEFTIPQVADLADELTPGPLREELKGTFDPTQETYEEYLRRINARYGGSITKPQTLLASLQKINPSLRDESLDFIRRENFSKKGFVSKYKTEGSFKGLKEDVVRDIKLIEPVAKKYEELQDLAINNPKGGTLKDFPDYKNFLIQEIDSVKDIKDATKIISRTQYHVDTPRTRSEARKLLLDNLIEIENKVIGRATPGHELAVQAGYRIKKGKDTTAPAGSFKNLISINEKKLNRVDDVLRQIDSGQILLDDIIKEGSLTRYINKPFGFKEPESFNQLIRKNKKYADRLDEFKLLNNFSFLNKYKGKGVLANEAITLFEAGRTGGKFASTTKLGPLKKIFEFADRYVKDVGGDKLRFVDENSFIYENKIFSTNPDTVDKRVLKKFGLQKAPVIDLVTEGPKRKEFKEIYKAFDKLREYQTIERPHPITGKQTPLTKLLQEADYIATGRKEEMAKNIFNRIPFEVDHFGGIGSDPFKNIRVIPRTLNQAAGQLARKSGYSTIQNIDKAEEVLGYKFTGNPIDSLNTYIDTEFQRGQNPNYTGRAKKIAGVKTKLIDEAIQEAGGTGTRGGQILTESLPEGVLRTGVDPRTTLDLEKSMTEVPILEKNPKGQVTMGSRPVTGKEVISVAERDAMAKSLARKILDLDLGFLPKKVSRPLEFGQQFIKGFGRDKFSVGSALKRGAQAAFTPAGITALFGPPDPDLTKPENRIALGLEAAFLKDLVAASVGATKGMKNRRIQKLLQQALNFGIPASRALKIARLVTPIGQLALAGEGIYQLGKFTKGRIQELEEMSDEEREDLRREADEFSFGEYSGAADGGIIRLGFAEGPDKKGLKSPSRRSFLKNTGKLVGIAALLPFGIGKGVKMAEKAAPVVSEGVKLGADKLMMLVEKIKLLGKRADKYSTKEGEQVTLYEGKDGSTYELIEDVRTGDVRVTRDVEGGVTIGDESYDTIQDRSEFMLRRGEEIVKDEGLETQKAIQTADEYEEGRAVFDQDGTIADVDEVDDSVIKAIEDEIN